MQFNTLHGAAQAQACFLYCYFFLQGLETDDPGSPNGAQQMEQMEHPTDQMEHGTQHSTGYRTSHGTGFAIPWPKLWHTPVPQHGKPDSEQLLPHIREGVESRYSGTDSLSKPTSLCAIPGQASEPLPDAREHK